MVEGKPVPGQRVLVYDTDGFYMGVSLAEKLAREGKTVSLRHARSPSWCPSWSSRCENHRQCRLLHELGVATLPAHIVSAIEPGG